MWENAALKKCTECQIQQSPRTSILPRFRTAMVLNIVMFIFFEINSFITAQSFACSGGLHAGEGV